MEGASPTNDGPPNEPFSLSNPKSEGTLESDATMTGASDQGGHNAPSPRVLTEDDLPGLRSWSGRNMGPEDVQEVIGLLEKAGVLACVVDVYALRYYGAGRFANEWNICVPDKDFDTATEIFRNDARFAPAKPVAKLYYSLLHTRPTFTMTGVGFYFILQPASDCFFQPSPDCWELSKNGIPYPKMQHFARSLLVLQDRCDLNDFIDGMNLDKEWADANVDFEDLQVQGREFTAKFNEELEKEGLGKLKLNVDYRSLWGQAVDGKPKRIEPMKQGRYKTRWRRIKNDTDPRLRDRPI